MLSQPLSTAKKLLLHQEGMRLKPYRDTTGKLTIGVGRDIEDQGIRESEALNMLGNDIVDFYRQLSDELPWFKRLDDIRQLALLSMAFNLGVKGLLEFKVMLHAISFQRYEDAAIALLNSAWSNQVGERALETAQMIKTGEIPHAILD